MSSPDNGRGAEPWLREGLAVAAELDADVRKGLSSGEAAARLGRFGPNQLEATAAVPAWRKLLAQFADPLIYLLLAEHAIEIVADRGVNRHVPQAQWEQIVQAMSGAFRAGRYEEGLVQAVDAVTALLERHFPPAQGSANPNELPDEPVLG